MWTWKHSLSLALVYISIASFFFDIKKFIAQKEREKINNFQLDCFDPAGDGSVTCYFDKFYNEKSHFNITVIKASGNLTIETIQSMTDIGFHKYNMPEYMPGNLGYFFTHLESLQITHSALSHLNRVAFKSMRRLHTLNLDFNEIEFIPSSTFNDLHDLLFLKLNGNKMKELQPPLVDRLHKLHTFSAVSNRITRIDGKFFRFNPRIKWIYLYGNKIEDLRIDFRNMKHLKAVDLRRNSESCNFLFNRNVRKNVTLEIFQRNITKFCN